MRDQRQLPPNRGGSDPQVSKVLLLVEWMTNSAALGSQPRVGPGRLVVAREHCAPVDQSLKVVQPLVTPACDDSAVPGLCNRLLGDHDTTPEDVLSVHRDQRRSRLQPSREDVRVEQNCCSSHSWIASTNRSHSSSARSGISKDSSSRSGSVPRRTSSRSPRRQKAVSAWSRASGADVGSDMVITSHPVQVYRSPESFHFYAKRS